MAAQASKAAVKPLTAVAPWLFVTIASHKTAGLKVRDADRYTLSSGSTVHRLRESRLA